MRFIDWLERRDRRLAGQVRMESSGLAAARQSEVEVRGESKPRLSMIQGERFKTYVSMRLFTSPSGRVLRRHLSPRSPWRAKRLWTLLPRRSLVCGGAHLGLETDLLPAGFDAANAYGA